MPRERAAAQYFNWLFHGIGNWAKWLDAIFGRPVSSIIGQRYLALRGDAESPGLELQSGTGADSRGEVQWSDPSLAGEDKRIAAVCVRPENGDHLDFHARTPGDAVLGAKRMSVHRQGASVYGKLLTKGPLEVEGALTLGSDIRGSVRLDVSQSNEVLLPVGEQIISASGRPWVGVGVQENAPRLGGISGGAHGQILLCEFAYAASGSPTFVLTIAHEDSTVPAHERIWLNGTATVTITNAGGAAPVCLFFRGAQRWRLLGVASYPV